MNSDGLIKCAYKDSGEVDQFNVRNLSEALVAANNFSRYLKEDYSKEEVKFITMSALIGIREGRRIIGQRVLKLKDIVEMKMQEIQPLFYTFANVDNHGKNIVFEDETLCDWFVAAGLWGVMLAVPIALDVLIPNKIENIMVAGRCLSVDHNLAAAVRMERDMHKCGEAAAYVCSEAIKRGIKLYEVNYSHIAEKLKKSKCLNEEYNIGFRERISGNFMGNELPGLKTSVEILKWLDSEKPGWGIWWTRLHAAENPELVEELKKNLENENENLARNSALALGIINETCALEKLREIAKEPDNYIPKSSLKYVYTRGVSAIYLLGKMADVDSVEMLFDIVERGGKTSLQGFTYNEFYCVENDVFSQYASFAVRALVDIAKNDIKRKDSIKERLIQNLEKPNYNIRVTSKGDSEGGIDLKDKLLEYTKIQLA